MYKQVIDFDATSFLEISSRITSSGEQLMLAMRGQKNDKEISVASLLLNENEVRQLILHLNGWLHSDKNTLNK